MNQVDDDSDNDSLDDENEDNFKDEDFDSNIKDDILKPASTRSKIVVNLIPPKDDKKGYGPDDKIEYDLDPYDCVRMKLIFEHKKLFNAYEKTINEIQ